LYNTYMGRLGALLKTFLYVFAGIALLSAHGLIITDFYSNKFPTLSSLHNDYLNLASTYYASQPVLPAKSFEKRQNNSSPHIFINGKQLNVEIVKTPGARELGLSGRTSLREDTGMLFVFETDAPWGIWMKDMKFPIDILWIDRDGTVLHVEKNATPESYPNIFISPEPARYVLEVNAGFAEKNWIENGFVVTNLPEVIQ